MSASCWTKTEIANLAITHARGAGISTFGSEETEEGIQVKRWYAFALDQVLRDIKPNFAKAEDTLTQASVPTGFKYVYQYPLPADFVYLIQLNGWGTNDYPRYCDIMQQNLHTDEEEAKIQYIFRNENESQYDGLFCEALALQLAVKITPRLSASDTLKRELMQEYIQAKALAGLRGPQENNPERRSRGIESTWIRARVNSTNG